MTDESLTVCPVCGRLTALRHDGTLQTHDFHPCCRAICMGAGHTPARAQQLADLRDYARERARYADDSA